MKILIDIGHPAHVHYFKNFIKIMRDKGHQLIIIARNKEMEHYLLTIYKLPFFNRGKGKKNLFSKTVYYFKAICLIYIKAKKFAPDLMMSFGSPYNAIVSKLIGKPHIVFNDTEHAKLSHYLTDPFSKSILTPLSYKNDLGQKQIRFDGYMELCYLHSNYFQPYHSSLDYLGVKNDEKYIVMRFVSWNASHDIGHSGLNLNMKIKIVKELAKHARVFISFEDEFSQDFNSYKLNIPPEKIHDILAYATLFLGEGATMASECAMLGTPAIYVNSLTAGSLEDQEKHGMIYGFRNSEGVLEKAIELLNTPNLKEKFQKRRDKMIVDKIDVTAFMTWFIENYPESVAIMKKDPDYQYKFLSAY